MKFRNFEIPSIFDNFESLCWEEDKEVFIDEGVQKKFPFGSKQRRLNLVQRQHQRIAAHKVGVLFSGGPAPGGHDVIAGIYDGLKKLNSDSLLYGFIDGPKGLHNDIAKLIEEEDVLKHKFTGGFSLLGTSRGKMDPDTISCALQTCTELDLDGLIIIGGDGSNSRATVLAEYFHAKGSKTVVIGVPKTIDGDLRNSDIEIPFGFDSGCKL